MNFLFLRAARNKLPEVRKVRSFSHFVKKIRVTLQQMPDQGQAPSRFPIFLYEQDQLTLGGRTTMTYISEEVLSGLENKYCKINQSELSILLEDVPATLPSFIKLDQDKKDTLHTFGITTLCFIMFSRDVEFLRRSGLLKKNVAENWENNRAQIKLYPRFEHGRNSSYNPQDKTMRFNFFRPSEKEDYLYICRSFDFVAHESGHAALDALRPDYYQNKDTYPEVAPLHEAFADITYLFLVLDQAILRHHLLNLTKSDLTKPSFFSNFGEEFGIKTNNLCNCARQALNDAKMGEGNPDPHHQSQALTGAIYDLIAEYFAWLKETCPFYSDEENLSRTGRDIRILFLRAVIEIPDSAVTFKRVGLQMLEIADQNESQEVKTFLKSTISRIFASRRIIPEKPIDP